MSSFKKLVRKFVFEPDKIDIGDVRRLLDGFGYEEKKKPGSECTFHKKGNYPINVPTVKGRDVKNYYVKRLARILELEEYLEKFEGD